MRTETSLGDRFWSVWHSHFRMNIAISGRILLVSPAESVSERSWICRSAAIQTTTILRDRVLIVWQSDFWTDFAIFVRILLVSLEWSAVVRFLICRSAAMPTEAVPWDRFPSIGHSDFRMDFTSLSRRVVRCMLLNVQIRSNMEQSYSQRECFRRWT